MSNCVDHFHSPFDVDVRCDSKLCRRRCDPASKQKCPECGLNVCGDCWSSDGDGACLLCHHGDSDHFVPEPRREARWTGEHLDYFRELQGKPYYLHRRPTEAAKALNAKFPGSGFSKDDVTYLFHSGTSDYSPLFGVNGRQVPFSDLVTIDDDGNGAWTEVARENMRRNRDPPRLPVLETPAESIPRKIFRRDVRDVCPNLSSIYTEVDPQTGTARAHPIITDDVNTDKITREVADERIMRKRNLILDSMFVLVWRKYIGLFRHFLSARIIDRYDDHDDLSSIDLGDLDLTHEEKRTSLLDFLRTTNIIPDWYESTFLSGEGEIRQHSTDDEINTAEMILDTKILSRWGFIREMLQFWEGMVRVVSVKCDILLCSNRRITATKAGTTQFSFQEVCRASRNKGDYCNSELH